MNTRQLLALKQTSLTALLLILFFVGTLISVGQDVPQEPNLVVDLGRDYLAVYTKSQNSIPVRGMQFRVLKGNQEQIIKLADSFTYLAGNGYLIRPDECLVYELDGAVPVLPSDCKSKKVLKVNLAAVNVFWIDAIAGSSVFVVIYREDQIVTPCPGAPATCEFYFPLPATLEPEISFTATLTLTPSPTLPIALHGSDNLLTPDYLSVNQAMNRTGIDLWHNAGFGGQGQSIGVLDHHFGGLSDFEKKFNTTISLMPGEDKNSYSQAFFTRGVNVLEVILQIAPDAELFACQYDSFSKFEECVEWMIEEGVRIINNSGTALAIDRNGQSQWSQVVDRAAEKDVLWVQAAGNFAGSRLQDRFFDTNGNGVNEFLGFGMTEFLAFTPIENVPATVLLTWGDSSARKADSIDLAIEIVNLPSGGVVASSIQQQQGRAEDIPFDYVVVDISSEAAFGIQIRDLTAGNTGTPFELVVEFARLPSGLEPNSIAVPGDSANALTVGTIRNAQIAPYSSRGPTSNGLNKPDLVAPGEFQLKDGTQFLGTSASSALVTGFAALVRQAYTDYSRQEVVDYLLKEAVTDDSQFQGADTTFGNGYLQAGTPQPTLEDNPENLLPTGTLTAALNTPTAVVTYSSVNLRGGPGTEYDAEKIGLQGDAVVVVAEAYNWFLVQDSDGEMHWVAASVMAFPTEERTLIPTPVTIPPSPTRLAPSPTATAFPPTSVPGGPNRPGTYRVTSTPISLSGRALIPYLTATRGPSPTPTNTLPAPLVLSPTVASVEGIDTFGISLYGVHLNIVPGTIRSEPNTGSPGVGQIACGQVVALVAQTEILDGRVWFQVGGGWVRQDVVKIYGTEDEAKAGAQANSAVCVPPTATLPQATLAPGQPTPTCGQVGQEACPPGYVPPPPPPPPDTANVTIVNNSACNISGSLGPAGFSVGAGMSTGVTVPKGRHTLSGGGDTCTVGPSEYDIQGDATITLG